jgi:penicillin amidase
MNVYGATFPGSPSVIIGFNDYVAFGFTNAQRDVKDYYRIRFKDDSKKEYWFDSAWKPTDLRVEEIRIKNETSFFDTVAYTVFGPVMYDEKFSPDSSGNALAVRWTGERTIERRTDVAEIKQGQELQRLPGSDKGIFNTGQNMLFRYKKRNHFHYAARSLSGPLERPGIVYYAWRRQQLYVAGIYSAGRKPHVVNPVSGFIQSANQRPVDSTYPYFIPGNYISARGITIEKRLRGMQNITPQDMMELQNDYYNATASVALPLFLKYLDVDRLNEKQLSYVTLLRGWDYNAIPESKATTIYQAWMDSVERITWSDDFAKVPSVDERPDEQTLVEALLKDSAFRYIDDINTSDTETIHQQITAAFLVASAALEEEEKVNGLVWYKHKNPSILHLLRGSVMPFARTGIYAGGWGNTINAINLHMVQAGE